VQASATHPTLPALDGGDLLEAALLRLTDDEWRKWSVGHLPEMKVGTDGLPVTGDAVLDKWTREAAEAWRV
jgi:hypothetical protein